MGEVEEQRYICKICSKSCVSGKSLGGHMRVHLALISSTKKAAKVKLESKMCDDNRDYSYQFEKPSKNQSNSTAKIKSEFEEGDPNNSYELRENPKKSWRFSDNPKRVISDEGVSCTECGKEFSSRRALSGHMRCHSMKNKVLHRCKECGKGFDSMRAMFGHMKSHSKKLKLSNDSADSVSDLDNLCPIRKKRSTIRYKIAPNPSFSSLNESTSADSELRKVKVAAKCLMMISRGVSHWIDFNSVTESDADDSVYFGAESSGKKKRVSGNDGDKMLEMDLLSGKLDYGVSGSVIDGNVFEFDGLVAENPKKVGLKISDNWLEVGNEMKYGLEASDHGLLRMNKLKELDQFECLNNQIEQESAGVGTEFTESQTEEAMAVDQEIKGPFDLFDLNFPVTVEGTRGSVGNNRWWGESGHEHELLVLTN